MENNTKFVFLAHLMPDILHFMFFFSRCRAVAILDLGAKMVSKLYNNNSSRFVIPDSLAIDTVFPF